MVARGPYFGRPRPCLRARPGAEVHPIPQANPNETMSDFIREVDEEYRRERAVQFLSRYQVLIALAIVAIVVGAGAWRIWVDNKLATAQADNSRYAAADLLAKQGKDGEARAAFEAIAKTGPAGYAMLARMRATAILAASQPEAAAKGFDAIASDDAIGPAMRDTARLRGAMIRVDTEDPKAFEQRYGRFAQPGFAFHNSMRELLALVALKRNDMKAAGGYLDAIIVDPVAPPALRNRAEAFRALVAAGPVSAGKAPAQPTPPATAKPEAPATSPEP